MPAIGDTIGLSLPTVSVTTGPSYATMINTALETLESILEQKINFGSIDIDQDWSFLDGATRWGLTDVDRVVFWDRGSVPADNYALYANGDELFFIDGTGTTVQLTSSGSVAAAAGNIQTTGSPAYGASGVQIQWDGTSGYYTFYEGAADPGTIRVQKCAFSDAATYWVTVDVPTLAASYTLSLPAAVPFQTELVSMDSSGNLDVSSNAPIDELHHNTFNRLFHWSDGLEANGGTYTNTNGYVTVAASDLWLIPLTFNVGDTIEDVIFYFYSTASSVTYDVVEVNPTTGAIGTLATGSDSSAAGWTNKTISPNWNIVSGGHVFARISRAGASLNFIGVAVNYSHP